MLVQLLWSDCSEEAADSPRDTRNNNSTLINYPCGCTHLNPPRKCNFLIGIAKKAWTHIQTSVGHTHYLTISAKSTQVGVWQGDSAGKFFGGRIWQLLRKILFNRMDSSVLWGQQWANSSRSSSKTDEEHIISIVKSIIFLLVRVHTGCCYYNIMCVHILKIVYIE